VGITGDDDLDAPDLAGGEADRKDVTTRQPSWAAPAGSVPIRHHARARQPLLRVRGRVERPTSAQAPSTPAGSPGSALLELSVSDLVVSLAAVGDEMGLLTWAKGALSCRGGLQERDRAALDEAFLQRAQAIGADPELLSAFVPAQETGEPELVPASSITPQPTGGHDAQAPL
jgi:hypothetical protein